MKNIHKLAAIDIGSNAVRFLITSIRINKSETKFKKISLVRVPLRLGEDVFSKGKISDKKLKKLQKTLKAFKILMQMHEVYMFKAVATSAMREAENSTKIIEDIFKKLNIKIDLISGKKEALMIANVFLNSMENLANNYLYVDVGGGSTELNLISKNKIIDTKSFKIGTVRTLNNITKDISWHNFKNWIENNSKLYKNIVVIGSGGNASKILKNSKKNINEVISISELEEINSLVKSMSFEDRIFKLQLNADRADVIIPAINIYLKSLKYSKSKSFIVPRIGLADGVIRHIHLNNNEGQPLRDFYPIYPKLPTFKYLL